MVKALKNIPLELLIWVTAFIILYNLNLEENDSTICPIHNLGFKWCPGCGLGKSIHLVLHGEFRNSFEMHWLGIPVCIVLFYRNIQLIRYKLKYKNGN